MRPSPRCPTTPAGDAWDALGELVGPARRRRLFRGDDLDPPDGWEVPFRLPGLQMVATAPIGEPDSALRPADDGGRSRHARARRAHAARSVLHAHVELGTYLGLREDGALVAMAGERMHLAGYTEISAVCTDEAVRKRGLATRLVRAIAAGIEARGETPILHVASDNVAAIRVYEALGFETRAPRTTSSWCKRRVDPSTISSTGSGRVHDERRDRAVGVVAPRGTARASRSCGSRPPNGR